jgi:hypothetical protein
MARGLSLLDLIQEGSLDPVRSAEKFDAELGVQFGAHATRSHGPYWFTYHLIKGRAVRRYVGKVLPDGIEAASAPCVQVPEHVENDVALEATA